MPINGTEFDDQLFGTTGDDDIYGLGGNDYIEGREGDDVLNGGDGDDFITGGNGSDLLYGGAGNDVILSGERDPFQPVSGDSLYGGDGDDMLILAQAMFVATYDTVEGGAGNDTLVIDGSEGVNLSLGYNDSPQSQAIGAGMTIVMSGIENVAGSYGDDILTGNDGANIIYGRDGSDYVDGSGGNDTIYGGTGNDGLNGADGADVIYGGDGYDFIDGWVDQANDTYDGGGDFDTVSYWAAGAAVSVDFNRASGQAQSLSGTSAGIGVDTLVSIEGIIGSNYGDRLVAATNSFAHFEGGDGDDTLIGGDVSDELVGGLGNDHIDGRGGDDYLLGDDGDDTILGGNGNDVIGAGSGSDYVNGGAGNDLAEIAEGGNDVFVGGSGSDTVELATGADITVDLRIQGTAQELVSGWLVTLTGVENIQGSFGVDVLIGDANNNILDGRDGIDSLRGGLGNDTYYVSYEGDEVVEFAGEGTDTVLTRGVLQSDGSRSYTLPENVENGSTIGEGRITFYGNSAVNSIYVSAGSMFGEGGNDRLYGGSWSNLLDGGTGADAMFGGAGDDTYFVDDVRDRVVENADEGFDTVVASTNYALVRNLERLDLVGTAINGSGNALDNSVYGNELDNRLNGYAGNDTLNGGLGNDWLDGGTGADHMAGGAGNDVYTIDNENDSVQDFDGNDTIRSYITYGLSPGNCDNIVLIGSSAINATGDNYSNLLRGNIAANILTGNNGDDILIGDAGNDTLYGGVGVDRLQGGTGIDQLWGGAGADKFVFDDGDIFGATLGSADVIHDFSHAEGDRIYLNLMDANINTVEDDAFTFIGSAAFSGTAGELRVSQYGADMLVRGDIDGDGVADFMIIVSNTTSLVASDFIF